LGYTAISLCNQVYVYRLDSRDQFAKEIPGVHEVTFVCELESGTHKVHLSEKDFPGVRLSMMWGSGKPETRAHQNTIITKSRSRYMNFKSKPISHPPLVRVDGESDVFTFTSHGLCGILARIVPHAVV